MAEKRLWEIEHPGYCELGDPNLPAGEGLVFSDWQDFRTNYANTPEVTNSGNLVYRWDWKVHADDYPDETAPQDTLRLFVINQQRGPSPFSIEVSVTHEDEQDVKAWLAERADAMRSVWAPLLDKVLEDI